MKHLEKQSFSILKQSKSLDKKSPIGIFDSGIGGLTVAKKLHMLLPGEKIIYFGDTARVPYGTKSKETIGLYAIQITGFLARFNPKLIIIACHSVSSLGTHFLEKKFKNLHFIDVINPSIEVAVRTTKNKKVGIIGTPATISSNRYPQLIRKIDRSIKVYQQPCPLLVPLVEEGWTDTDVTKKIIEHYIEPLIRAGIDTLILGCTHYPLLKRAIRKVTGNSVQLIDASDVTGMKVKNFLAQFALLNDGGLKKPVLYFSDLPENRKDVMRRFWKSKNLIFKKVNIDLLSVF